MLDTAMNLNLTHQLLLGTTLGQAGLLDDLGGVYESGVSIDEFVTFSEASFPKKLAFKVPTDTDFSTFFLKFLLNDGLT